MGSFSAKNPNPQLVSKSSPITDTFGIGLKKITTCYVREIQTACSYPPPRAQLRTHTGNVLSILNNVVTSTFLFH